MTQRTIKRYSETFKRQVVAELESGRLSIEQARKRYDIGGQQTLYRWLERYGKNRRLCKVIHIQSLDEQDPMTRLEQENKHLRQQQQALESALAQAQLKILALESTITAANEHFQVDVKKNFSTRASTAPAKR